MGTSRWINNYVKEFPIPEAACEQQTLIIELVDQILAVKRTDPDENVCELENQIDQIVYLLYDLTPGRNCYCGGKRKMSESRIKQMNQMAQIFESV